MIKEFENVRCYSYYIALNLPQLDWDVNLVKKTSEQFANLVQEEKQKCSQSWT